MRGLVGVIPGVSVAAVRRGASVVLADGTGLIAGVRALAVASALLAGVTQAAPAVNQPPPARAVLHTAATRATFGLAPLRTLPAAELSRAWRLDGQDLVAMTGATWLRLTGRELEFRLASVPQLPVRLRTTSVSTSASQVDAPCWPAGTSLECEGQSFVEVFEHRGDGVEQRWHFRRPDRLDAITIDVLVSGRSCTVEPGGGATRCLDEVGSGLHIGAATWVDARGARWPVAASPIEHGFRLTVAADIVKSTRWPAVLDPLISPVLGIPGLDALQPSANQVEAASASSAQRTLMAWIDERSGGGELLIAQVGPDGTQAPASLVRAPSAPFRESPAVAADPAGRFLITWAEADSLLGPRRVMALQLDATGAPTWPEPVQVFPANLDPRAPAVSADASGWLLAARLQPPAAPTTLGVVQLTTSGQVGAVQQNAAIAPFGGPRLASSPMGVALAVEIVRGDRLGLLLQSWVAGAVSSSNELVSTAAHRLHPVIAARLGGGFWLGSTVEAATGRSLELLELSQQVVPGTTPVVLSTTGQQLSLASHAVAWVSAPAIHLQRLDAAGLSGAAQVLTRPAAAGPVTLSSTTSSISAAWGELVGSTLTLIATRWSPPVSAPAPRTFARVGSSQSAPALTSFGDGLSLVVYEDRRTGRSVDLWAARVSSDGGVLDGAGFLLVGSVGDQLLPAVAATPELAMAVFVDTRTRSRELWSARVSRDGVVLDDDGVELGLFFEVGPPAITAARSFVVAAATRGSTAIVVREVSVLGRPAPMGLVLQRGSTNRRAPKLARIPTGFYLAWESTTDVATAGSDIVGTALSENLVPNSLNGTSLVERPQSQSLRGIGGGDAGVVVVFEEARGTGSVVYAARVTAGGEAMGAPEPISPIDGAAAGSSTAFVGNDALVAWKSADGGVDTVQARWVSAGAGASGPSFALGEVLRGASATTLSVDSSGRGAIGLSRFDDAVAGDRLWLRTFVAAAPGQPCGTSEGCASGVCVEGLCCDRPCGAGDCEACSRAKGALRDGVCGPTPGRVCRASADVCDVEERCGPTELTCPADGLAPDGASCGEGFVCEARSCVEVIPPTEQIPTRKATSCSTTGEGGAVALLSLTWLAAGRWRRRRAVTTAGQPDAGATPAALGVLGLTFGLLACAPVDRPMMDAGADGDAGLTVGVDAGPLGDDFGARCTTNTECDAGLCLPSGVCSRACGQRADCPALAEWTCASSRGALFCQCVRQGVGEACDGRDNDCNGIADDGALCTEAGTRCEAGRCVCAPENSCGGQCVDRSSNPLHCGACGVVCNQQCVNGACACQSGRTLCGGDCVVLEDDLRHCGGCGQACGDGQRCTRGACEIDFRWARWPVADQPTLVATGETALDVVTGLQWARSPLPTEATDQLQAEQACVALRLQGRRDWRLPSRVELNSIFDYSRPADPLWDTQVLRGPSGAYWTSSWRPFGAFREAWVLSGDGTLTSFFQGRGWVRCVR